MWAFWNNNYTSDFFCRDFYTGISNQLISILELLSSIFSATKQEEEKENKIKTIQFTNLMIWAFLGDHWRSNRHIAVITGNNSPVLGGEATGNRSETDRCRTGRGGHCVGPPFAGDGDNVECCRSLHLQELELFQLASAICLLDLQRSPKKA